MATSSGERRVTDVTLNHWEAEAKKEPPGKLGSINLPAVVEMLIAEVRASRAREAAWQQRWDFQHGVAQGWLANWKAAQQRINTALAACDNVEPEALSLAIRTALTGERDRA